MALVTKIKDLQEKIIKELKNKTIKIKKIHSYSLGNKMYLFNIICTDKRLGELKLHKSVIKQIASNKNGYTLVPYLIREIHWSE